MEYPKWLDRAEYPFASHVFPHPDGDIHYVDEGDGPVILFVHGTPEWSFAYRHQVRALSAEYRCIAPDHLGMGLSAKPTNADYSPQAQAQRLRDLILHLGLQDVLLVAGDFGGAMAISYALEEPANVRGLFIWNSWCWSLADDTHFARPGKLVRTALGRFLYLRLNFTIRVMMPRAFADKGRYTAKLKRHYAGPLDRPAHRRAAYGFARGLLGAGDWWEDLYHRREILKNLPMQLCWGMKDQLIPARMIAKWKEGFPEMAVTEIENAGHFPHEEQPEAMLAALRAFADRCSDR